MNFTRKFTFFCFIAFNFIAKAQDMSQGFDHLEKGDFNKAELFFETILKEYPQNKTARLCYARAVGLNKDPEKALGIFIKLRTEYPDDLEIKLNYAESLLWNKNFKDAKVFYTKLVADYPTNFVANLGYANTLSNLKEFQDALFYVNRALEIDKGNSGALVSRKYIKLGYANQKIIDKSYSEAENFYNEILVDFHDDKETLLNKANLYLMTKNIDKGKAVYSILSKTDPILALNGMSLIEHIDGKDKKALAYSEEAIEKTASSKDINLIKQTQERYAQALIWNKKFKSAELKINELNTKYPNENWALSLAATLAIYRSDFKESVTYYQTILANDSKSFDGNLGVANAYYASGEINAAFDAVKTTLTVFEKQKDATNFLKRLNEEHTPVLEEKLSYSFDNGNNTAMFSRTLITFPLSTKWSTNMTYQFRKTGNSITNIRANSNDFLLGLGYKFHPKISFNLEAGITSANSTASNYTQPLITAYFKMKPLKLQDLEIGYKREIQNFNTDLIDKEIATHNYYLNYNMGTNFNLGWFTQYFFTTQTDSNERNLLFTSFYYNFMSQPILKGGLNYQFISFKDQVPTIYFSPKKFNAFEIFVDFLKDEKITENKSWFYNANAALGYQFIEDNEKQLTYRIQARLGYKFSDRLLANLYGGKSNIASVSVAGFTYTEFGLRLRWVILKKPVFHIKAND
jgi:tetratricopeptide (TPR) repeat protein